MSRATPRRRTARLGAAALAALLVALTAGACQPAAPPRVTCVGDGASGRRIQLIYAHRVSDPDRFAEVRPELQQRAADVEAVFRLSAAKTGGGRIVRWAHDAGCVATVLHETVADTVTSFHDMVNALRDRGLSGSDRKYFVAWDDADHVSEFCGLGTQFADDTPGAANANERNSVAAFAAGERGCWGTGYVAHEIMHTLGGVPPGAPHATGDGHCTDDPDLMCHTPAGTTPGTACPTYHEMLFDCGGDDYFSTAPPAGSWLADHWNAADSTFLEVVPAPAAPAGATGT